MKRHLWQGIKMGLVATAIIFIVIWAMKLGCANSWAETKKIIGTTNIKDTFAFIANPDYNYGGWDELYVIIKSGYYARTLIAVVDVASELGAGATNITAVCSVYCFNQYADDSISAYRVFKPVVEGVILHSTCIDSGASWNDWNCTDYEWTTPGCDCAGDDGSDNNADGGECGSATRDRKATAEGSAVSVATDDTWYGWTISTELATGWYNGTISERGIVLIGSLANGENYFAGNGYVPDPTKYPFFVFTYDVAGVGTKLLPIAK